MNRDNLLYKNAIYKLQVYTFITEYNIYDSP